jgi:hypothetical protein
MSVENVRIAKEALSKVLSDVKETLGDSASDKITSVIYETRYKKLVEELGFLEEGLFAEAPVDDVESPEA